MINPKSSGNVPGGVAGKLLRALLQFYSNSVVKGQTQDMQPKP